MEVTGTSGFAGTPRPEITFTNSAEFGNVAGDGYTKETLTTATLSLLESNEDCSFLFEESLIKDVVIPSIYIVICVIGLLGNGLVLGLLIKQDKNSMQGNKRSVTNILVINLAVADFIFVGAMPFWATERFMRGYWIFGTLGCKLLSFISLLNLYGSVFFLVAMGIDRYLAIVFAVKVRNYRTPRNAIRVCVGIWLFASLIASQGLLFRKVDPSCPGHGKCVWSLPPGNGWIKAYFVIRTGLGFFLPFFVIVYCYIFIIVSLRKRSQNLSASGVRITNNQQKVTRLILTVISMFVVCWLPNHIVTLISATRRLDSEIALFTTCPAYANSMINPILYAFMKDDVRMRLIRMMRRCFGLNDEQNGAIVSRVGRTQQPDEGIYDQSRLVQQLTSRHEPTAASSYHNNQEGGAVKTTPSDETPPQRPNGSEPLIACNGSNGKDHKPGSKENSPTSSSPKSLVIAYSALKCSDDNPLL